jgi:hypothetical protein
MTKISDIDWELVYDYQKTDSWDKKSVTVKVYNHKNLYISQAIVVNDITGNTKKKKFMREDHESAALRWANDVSLKIVYGTE